MKAILLSLPVPNLEQTSQINFTPFDGAAGWQKQQKDNKTLQFIDCLCEFCDDDKIRFVLG